MEHDSQESASSTAGAAETKTKRHVSYNQDAVLCPDCKKRIRLNNDGRIRAHVSGKAGSGRCQTSGTLADAAGIPLKKDLPQPLFVEP